MRNNQEILWNMESINRVDGELTWLVQSKGDMNMRSINRLPCLSCKEFTTVLGSGAYWGVDGELTWLVQSKGHGVMNAK